MSIQIVDQTTKHVPYESSIIYVQYGGVTGCNPQGFKLPPIALIQDTPITLTECSAPAGTTIGLIFMSSPDAPFNAAWLFAGEVIMPPQGTTATYYLYSSTMCSNNALQGFCPFLCDGSCGCINVNGPAPSGYCLSTTSKSTSTESKAASSSDGTFWAAVIIIVVILILAAIAGTLVKRC